MILVNYKSKLYIKPSLLNLISIYRPVQYVCHIKSSVFPRKIEKNSNSPEKTSIRIRLFAHWFMRNHTAAV